MRYQLLMLSATAAAAPDEACTPHNTGDTKFMTCAAFCKEEQAKNHCAPRKPPDISTDPVPRTPLTSHSCPCCRFVVQVQHVRLLRLDAPHKTPRGQWR